MKREGLFCDTESCQRAACATCAVCSADVCELHHDSLELQLVGTGALPEAHPRPSLNSSPFNVCTACRTDVRNAADTSIYNDLLDDLADSIKAARVESDLADAAIGPDDPDDFIDPASGDTRGGLLRPVGYGVYGNTTQAYVAHSQSYKRKQKGKMVTLGDASCVDRGHFPRLSHRCPNKPDMYCTCCNNCEASCYLTKHGRI